MTETVYTLAVIAAAVYGVVRGFRRGLALQISDVLGLCFGVVCVHVFAPAVIPVVAGSLPIIPDPSAEEFTVGNIAGAAIYTVVYFLLKSLTGILRSAMAVISSGGMLDSILGSAFGLLRHLMWLSIGFNLIICFDNESVLIRNTAATDGNIVRETTLLSPSAFGTVDAEDLAHSIQLREARKIS